MEAKQNKAKGNVLICKNIFKESTESGKGRVFTEKWIKTVEDCEKLKNIN